MDADIVREIEFSRSLRGYNTAEVDAFLERMEGMFRRRDLEQENLEKKLQEQSQRGTEQENRISFLAAKVEEGQREAEALRAELANAQTALEAEKAQTQSLNEALAAARAEALQAEERCKVLEKTLEAKPKIQLQPQVQLQPQFRGSGRLAEVGAAAKDSLKKLSGSLRSIRK